MITRETYITTFIMAKLITGESQWICDNQNDEEVCELFVLFIDHEEPIEVSLN